MILLCMSITLVHANVNVSMSIESQGGNIDFRASPNSGTGLTNYYLDGLNFKDYKTTATNSRNALITGIHKAFMDWRMQTNGKFGWQETIFEDLTLSYQKLRYVLETWFVPRKELSQVIQNQQTQITQLQLEIKSIQIVLGETAMCDARKQVMTEMDLPFITCGNTTWYQNGIGLQSN